MTIGSPEVVGTPALLAFLRELIADWDSREGEGCEVSRARGLDNARLVYGFVAHTADLARGVVALYESGLGYTALRLIRGAMECATSAAWLTHNPEQTNRLLYTNADEAQTILDEVKQYGLAGSGIGRLISENERTIADLTKSGVPAGLSMMDRFTGLEGGAAYYVQYRFASAQCHPTAALSSHYIDQVPISSAAPSGLVIVDRPTDDRDMVGAYLGQMACMVVIAMIAYESILSGGTQMDALLAKAHRVGIPGRIERHLTKRERAAAKAAGRAA